MRNYSRLGAELQIGERAGSMHEISRLTEWVDDEKSTCHRSNPVLSTYKSFSEELDIDPESHRIF